MKLLAAVLLLLPLQALADRCYYCANYPHVGAVAPTYDCGVKCDLSDYDTSISTYHCWKDSKGADSCFKKCCKKDGKEMEYGSGW
jgi:hypothetical protein